ncbi:MAG: sulfotransferase [SAR324 cluster bacterium]|nr:sulfotransferase [SAR324 cluster bacterium]
MFKSNYGLLDKLLHYLALQIGPVAELSFDLDQNSIKIDPEATAKQKHVFVSGLARAGTTVLMKQFHSTGQYRSLEYNDMPFILAPNLWRKLSSISQKERVDAVRAHGDNIVVNVDSPESLDEVFWRVFSGSSYLFKDHLSPYNPTKDTIQKFVRYVAAIIASGTEQEDLYLSKNNNNIMRLGAIGRAFPNALIVIPFRDPLNQAYSLLNQHLRFLKIHKEDSFSLSYMKWLSHHEFGLDHRPFQFESSKPNLFPLDSLDYWLQIWTETYGWVLKNRPKTAKLVCYEKLCTKPKIWDELANLAGIDESRLASDELKLVSRSIDVDVDPSLRKRAKDLYAELLEQC